MNTKRPIAIDDLLKIQRPTEIAISPDGELIAYTLAKINEKQDKYNSNIWMLNSKERMAPFQFTQGDHIDAKPRFSPDGKWLAFISNRSGKSQIYIIPRNGGEASALTNLEGKFAAIGWAPDSKMLAFIFRRDDPDEKKDRPRRITRLDFKEEGSGICPEDYFHLWTVSIDGKEPKQLTSGPYNHSYISWSPDGMLIATTANRHENAPLDPDNTDIWILPRDGGEARQITKEWGPVFSPVWCPDGKNLIYIGHRIPSCNYLSRNAHVWKVDLKGSAVDLMPDLDLTCLNLCLSDQRTHADDTALWFSSDGSCVYTIVSDHGTTQIYSLPLNGGKAKAVTQGKHDIVHFSVSKEYIALAISNQTNPGEVYRLDLTGEGIDFVPLTKHNEDLLAQITLSTPEEISVPGNEGNAQGWIYRPPDFDPGKKYPMIVEIHGGPYSFYGNTFFHEMQWLASCGYVVMCLNPPGSQSYGENYAKSLNSNWTKIDYPYQMKAIDMMIERGYVDEKRLALTGGSYGGLMINWIISHTNRFAVAVTERCLSELCSFFGTGDAGIYFRWEFSGYPWEIYDKYWQMSPLAHVSNIKTPLLIIHGVEDQRTPIAQAEELFVALKILNKEVELLRFPDETHDLSRTGKPKHRIERLQAIRDWFDKHLMLVSV